VQWDIGKMEKVGVFQHTRTLNKPPPVLLHALQSIKTRHITDGNNLSESLSMMLENKPRMKDEFGYQGSEHNQLFEITRRARHTISATSTR
jgi:hypothetical protein